MVTFVVYKLSDKFKNQYYEFLRVIIFGKCTLYGGSSQSFFILMIFGWYTPYHEGIHSLVF
jgi:hypothetical protein